MKQHLFVHERDASWRRFEAALGEAEAGRAVPADFATAHRRLCQDTALAQERGFGAGLVERLESLSLRGHDVLYGTRPPVTARWRDAVVAFPIALRREWRLMSVMVFLLYGLGAASYFAVRADPEIAYTVVGVDDARRFEQMYDPDTRYMDAPRDTTGDLGAFGHYVQNNIGIGFRTFASGILFGVGSILLVGFNGILLGGAAGHIVNVGHGETFWPFVVGHGAFELNAIVVCGMCGLRLGLAVTAPGRRRRADALRHATRSVLPLLYGGTAWLAVAAVIEAFWSSNHRVLSHGWFYGVGALLWVGVVAYVALAGTRRAA